MLIDDGLSRLGKEPLNVSEVAVEKRGSVHKSPDKQTCVNNQTLIMIVSVSVKPIN